MQEAIIIIEQFFTSFDTRDWQQMEACLDKELTLDYQSFRGTPKYVSTAEYYIEKRKKGLNSLNTLHKTSDYLLSESGNTVKCTCSFEIRRYEINSEEYFHSFGQYEIWIKKINEQLKIYKIKQIVERNEGNRNIHGAFKK